MTTPPKDISLKKTELICEIFKLQSVLERITELENARRLLEPRPLPGNIHLIVVHSKLRQYKWIEEELLLLEKEMADKLMIK